MSAEEAQAAAAAAEAAADAGGKAEAVAKKNDDDDDDEEEVDMSALLKKKKRKKEKKEKKDKKDKKKKKKKKKESDGEAAASEAAAAEAGSDDAKDGEEAKAKAGGEDGDGDGDGDGGDGDEDDSGVSGSKSVPWAGTDRDYAYTELLERIFKLLREKNPGLATRKRHVMPPPQLVRIGTRKTMWANFAQIANLMRRQVEHVMQFVLAELGTQGSLDGNQRLVVRGRYQPKQIESLLKRYIVGYVTCHMCRNPETTLTRDPVTRLHFLECDSCSSRRSVAPIKSGFHATMRGDRRKAKA